MSEFSRLDIKISGSHLTIVPAVHYRVPFAEAVNRIACDMNSRPDVIAVELGPGITATVLTWLREIGIGPARRRSLPCLLGLVGHQRYLSPKVREKALALQIETGLRIDELPADVLDLELNFRSSLVLPLSPTDSIIEALRCALELDIPVYGVDLEEQAPDEPKEILYPDTVSASGQVETYINENAGFLNSLSLTSVNRRREYAMAARLKELMLSHKRILFTCGLGHWSRLPQLMHDPKVRATTNIKTLGEGRPGNRYKRVVIHPSEAIRFLDRLPAVARLYQRQRRHPLLGTPLRTPKPVLVREIYKSTLRHGIRYHIRIQSLTDSGSGFATGRLGRLREFPLRVLSYSALGLNEVPSVTSTLRCAKTFISEPFAASLAKSFFRFPWARAEDYKNCEALRPPKGYTLVIRNGEVLAEPTRVNGTRKEEWVDSDGTPLEGSSIPESDLVGKNSGGYNFTWEPWENLITGLCDEAITLSLKAQTRGMAEPFRGSLQRGIAFKETLLARARGEKALQVYAESSAKNDSPADLSEGWPVVWIFDTEGRGGCKWTDLIVPLTWLKPFLDNDTGQGVLFDSADKNLSSLICFEDKKQNPGGYKKNGGVQASTLRGIIAFGPVFHHDQQYARWLELTRGLRNPLFTRSYLSDIPKPVSRHCASMGTPLGVLRWQDDIVRVAIPYAGRQVTVVLPRHYQLDPVVYQETARLGKHLSLVSLERFSASDIQRARSNLMVPGLANASSPQYEANAQSSIAEERERFAHRMPEKWKRFGL